MYSVGTYRKSHKSTTSRGYDIDIDCTYDLMEVFDCVIMSLSSDSNERDHLEQGNSFQMDREIVTFHIKTWEQDKQQGHDIMKTDYVIFREVFEDQEVDHAYKIIGVTQVRLVTECCLLKLRAEKLEPRECQNTIRGCGEIIFTGDQSV